MAEDKILSRLTKESATPEGLLHSILVKGVKMVHYMATTGAGIECYAETERALLDVPRGELSRRVEYTDPAEVDPRALKPNAVKLEQGYRVRPSSLPKKMLWANGDRPLPDVLPRFVVSHRFRDIVENFEPDVHQFIPINVYRSRDGEPVETYYWFVICQRIDSVDRDKTTYKWRPHGDGFSTGSWIREKIDPKSLDFITIPNAELVHSSRLTEGFHIWRDPSVLVGGERLCSDEFAAAVAAGIFTGVGSVKCATV